VPTSSAMIMTMFGFFWSAIGVRSSHVGCAAAPTVPCA
jgi:hypothetical protein